MYIVYIDISIFCFVRASSASDHSYGKAATRYQMQYIIIIIIITQNHFNSAKTATTVSLTLVFQV